MLDSGLVVFSFTIDNFDGEVFGAQVVGSRPGAHVDVLAQAQLPVASALGVEFQPGPGFTHLLLPGCQHARLLVAILLDTYSLLDFRHVEARRILFHHALHTEGGGAGAYGLFHNSDPAMRNAVRALLVESGDHLFLERLVERKAIGLILRVGVVVFAFLADGPAILAVEAFGPPAV